MKAPYPATNFLLQKPPGLRTEPGEALLLYLDRIHDTERRGESREESFYRHLLDLLDWFAGERGLADLRVVLIPRKTEHCLLDFQVWRGERIAGYVEAKRPGTNLDLVECSEQIERYRRTFPNLLLTNFREFRLYRHGQPVLRAHAGAQVGRPEKLLELLELFAGFDSPASVSTAVLAERLAGRTRVLAARIHELLMLDPE
ncbi:MAG: hypothetical protein ACREMY_30180, partial [bacterium]